MAEKTKEDLLKELRLSVARLKKEKELADTIDDVYEKQKKISEINKEIKNTHSQIIKIFSEIKLSSSEVSAEYMDQRDMMQSLNAKLLEVVANRKKELTISSQLGAIDRTQIANLKAVTLATGKEKDFRLEIHDLSKQMVNTESMLLEGKLDSVDIESDLAKIAELRTDISKSLVGKNSAIAKKLQAQLNVYEKMANSQKLLLDHEQSRMEIIDAGLDNIQEGIRNFTKTIENIPGGSLLTKVLGLEDFSKTFTSNLRESLAKGESMFSTFSKTVGAGFSRMVSGLMSPLGGILVMTGILAGAIALVNSLQSTIMDISKELGISNTQAKQLVDKSREWNSELTSSLGTSEDIRNAQSELITGLGNISYASQENVDNIISLNKAYGVTQSAAVGVLGVLIQMGATSEKAGQLMIGAANLAEKAGVPVAAVMADIADNADLAHKYFAGNTDELMKQAVHAQKIGLSLSKLDAMASSILDIESSLEKEMSAQVLLGKQITFDKARQLLLSNDLVGMGEEMINQLGTIEEFNDMDFIQKQAIADAIGLSVSELGNALEKQEMISNLSGDLKKDYKDAQDRLGQLNKEQEKNLVRQAEAEVASKAMAQTWDEIKISLEKIIQPLGEIFVPLLDKAAKVLGWMLSHTGVMQTIMIGIATIWTGKMLIGMSKFLLGTKSMIANLIKIRGLSSAIDFMSPRAGKPGGGVADQAARTSRKMKSADSNKVSSFTKGFNKINFGKVLKGAAALAILAGTMYILAKAMQEFSTGVSWEGVAMGITAISALAAVSLILGIFSPVAIPAAAAMGILAGAMWILGKAMQEFAKAAVIAIPFFEAVFEGISKVIDTIGTAMSKVFSTLFDGFKNLAEIGPQLFVAAGGILSVAGALAIFAGSSVLGAIGSIFSGTVINKIEKIADMASEIDIFSNAVGTLANSLERLQKIDIANIYDKIANIPETILDLDISGIQAKISKIHEQIMPDLYGKMGIVGNVDAPEAPIISDIGENTIGDAAIENEILKTNAYTVDRQEKPKSESDSEIIRLLNVLINKIDQPQLIKIGTKTIDEINSIQSMKRNITLGLDKSYGRLIS